MKKVQSYTNDRYVWFVEKWFEHHMTMTADQYLMLKKMVWYARDKK